MEEKYDSKKDVMIHIKKIRYLLTKVVNGIKNLLNMSKNNLGEYYYPCRPEKTKDNICPCIHHLKEIDE